MPPCLAIRAYATAGPCVSHLYTSRTDTSVATVAPHHAAISVACRSLRLGFALPDVMRVMGWLGATLGLRRLICPHCYNPGHIIVERVDCDRRARIAHELLHLRDGASTLCTRELAGFKCRRYVAQHLCDAQRLPSPAVGTHSATRTEQRSRLAVGCKAGLGDIHHFGVDSMGKINRPSGGRTSPVEQGA